MGTLLEGESSVLQEQAAHDEAVLNSDLLELHCTSHQLGKLEARELHTVLQLLQVVAARMRFPQSAAAWLRMEFAEATLPHQMTLQAGGICDQAQFTLLGEAEAAKAAEADKVSIVNAAKNSNLDNVLLVCSFYPERVNSENLIGWTALHYAAQNLNFDMAELLIGVGADTNAKSKNGKSPRDVIPKESPQAAQITRLLNTN